MEMAFPLSNAEHF